MKIGVAKNKKKIFVSLYKKNIELHPLWLRERVNNQELLDQNTGQRLYDPSDLNQRLKIKRALIKNKSLSVEFSDGIESVYQIEDLINEINKNLSNKKISLWNSKIKNKPILRFKLDMFNNKEGYFFLEKFYKYGFSILKNTPVKNNFVFIYGF